MATSDASDGHAADRPDHPDRDYIHPDRQGHWDRDCIRCPDCSHLDPEVHQDHASAADPDEPDRCRSDAQEPDSPDASASLDEAEAAHREPADAYSVSPPYPDAEELWAWPVADRQDSAWLVDAKAAKASSASAHPAAQQADEAAREYSERAVSARRA